jgi:hypothetical protein
MQLFTAFFLAVSVTACLALPEDGRYAQAPGAHDNVEQKGLNYFLYYTDAPTFPHPYHYPERRVENFIQFGFTMGKRDPAVKWLINPAFEHIGTPKGYLSIARCIRTFVNEPTGWEWSPEGVYPSGPAEWRKGCEHFGCGKCFWLWEQKGDTLRYVDLYEKDFNPDSLSAWSPFGHVYTAGRYLHKPDGLVGSTIKADL